MPVEAPAQVTTTVKMFPADEVRRRLAVAIQAAAGDEAILQGDWEPCLDSLTMVSVIVALEDLFDFQLPPERLVRRGGYPGQREGVEDMMKRLEGLWNKRHRPEVRT